MEKIVKCLWKWEADGELYGPCIILAEDDKYYTGYSAPEGFKNLNLVRKGNIEAVEKLINDGTCVIEITLEQEVIISVPEKT